MGGAGLNSTLSGSTILAKWCDQAEGELCALTRRDWLTLSGSTLASYAPFLSQAIAARVGMKAINYDMSGYTSRVEAQTMLDVLRDIWNTSIEALKDDKVKQAVI